MHTHSHIETRICQSRRETTTHTHTHVILKSYITAKTDSRLNFSNISSMFILQLTSESSWMVNSPKSAEIIVGSHSLHCVCVVCVCLCVCVWWWLGWGRAGRLTNINIHVPLFTWIWACLSRLHQSLETTKVVTSKLETSVGPELKGHNKSESSAPFEYLSRVKKNDLTEMKNAFFFNHWINWKPLLFTRDK
jgi:hypothetical protein